MRFLANENMPGSVISRLKASGHNVLAARETLRGELDNVIPAPFDFGIEIKDKNLRWHQAASLGTVHFPIRLR